MAVECNVAAKELGEGHDMDKLHTTRASGTRNHVACCADMTCKVYLRLGSDQRRTGDSRGFIQTFALPSLGKLMPPQLN